MAQSEYNFFFPFRIRYAETGIPIEIKLDIPIDLFFRTDKQSYIYKALMKRVGFKQWETIEYLKSRYCLNFVFPESSVRKNGEVFLLNPNQRDSIRIASVS